MFIYTYDPDRWTSTTIYAFRPSLVNNCADKALNEINVVRPNPLTRNKQTGVYIKKNESW